MSTPPPKPPKLSATVKALWAGPAGLKLDGVELVPGETVIEISRGEAQASDNWKIKE